LLVDSLTIMAHPRPCWPEGGSIPLLPQFTGLLDCQARSKAKLDFHFNASLTAVSLAKLEALQRRGEADLAFSMASLKRRAFNQHLIERICEHFANGQSLEKSSPDYEELCNYGTITDLAA
jgi:hypothetical protein